VEKSTVLDFFGGLPVTASVMGISQNAIRAWPDQLPEQIAARVIGRAVKLRGIRSTRKQWPDAFER